MYLGLSFAAADDTNPFVTAGLPYGLVVRERLQEALQAMEQAQIMLEELYSRWTQLEAKSL